MAIRQGPLEGLVMNPDQNFWRGKRVLLTGHTGFKGAWLLWWLHRMGAHVTGMALAPHTSPSLFTQLNGEKLCESHIVSIQDLIGVKNVVKTSKPDIVFHLAAEALVRTAYANPVSTFSTNVLGTVHLLEALRTVYIPKVVVAVTTDKVYHNREWTHPYRENDRLGGHDPYSASKAACEIAIDSYIASFLNHKVTGIAKARAGNVIGGGDWSTDRLIPDAIRAWSRNETLIIRNPQSVRPWQHVLEPLNAYLLLAEQLWDSPELAQAYNFGPPPDQASTVQEVITRAQHNFGRGQIQFAEQFEGPHEAGLLVLDNSKARHVLGIQPRWNLDEAVRRTVHWYQGLERCIDAQQLCLADLHAFLESP
jgi:CDP-glucose 4,6-dehydratase